MTQQRSIWHRIVSSSFIWNLNSEFKKHSTIIHWEALNTAFFTKENNNESEFRLSLKRLLVLWCHTRTSFSEKDIWYLYQ